MTVALQNIKSFYNIHLVISQETKDKISNAAKNTAEIAKKTANKIVEFVKENKSLIIFGLSVLFAYYMAPASAFEYMSYWGYSLKEAFVEGAILGSSVLILKNLFTSRSFTKNQDDQINYLSTIANICETYLCPTCGLVNAFATAGFITVKTAFNKIFASDDKDIYFMVEKPKK